MIAAFEPLGYNACFLLKTLYLQSGQPGVDGQLWEGGKDGIAGRINLCLPKLFIAQADSVGASEHHLGNQLTVRAVHITIRFAHHVQDDGIIRTLSRSCLWSSQSDACVCTSTLPTQSVPSIFSLALKKIGACIHVRQTGIYHFYRPAGGCLEC